MTVRLHKDVIAALNQSGHKWWVESGGKHNKIFIAGRLALVVSRGKQRESGRQNKNDVGTIRRVCRELENKNV